MQSSSAEVTTVSSRPRTSRRPASRCWSSNADPWSAALASRRKFIRDSVHRRSPTPVASFALKSRPIWTSRRSDWTSTCTIRPSSSRSRTADSYSTGTTRSRTGSRSRSFRRRTRRPGLGTRISGMSSRNSSSRRCSPRRSPSRTSHRCSEPRRRRTSCGGSSSAPSRTCSTSSSSPTR